MSEDDGLVIQIDEARIRDHLGEMVRGTVEETLNALLDAEADRLNLADARLRHIAGTTWSAKCYMNMRPLYQQQLSETEAVA